MPFSYTAPSFSKAEQEHEYAELSLEEKEEILDDAYGRNSEEVAAFNERAITQQELDAFEEALENLPLCENLEAIAATTVMCPMLVQSETNPSLFLRREMYDPQNAAKRFAAYWKFRVDLFGNEKAYLPMTLSEGGAYCEEEETLQMMRELPTYRYILPNDSHGRSVVFMESNQENIATNTFSRDAKLKYVFYVFHRLMKQQSCISRGFVALYQLNVTNNNRQFKLNDFDRMFTKQNVRFFRECCPIQLRAAHFCTSQSSLITDWILPAALYFWATKWRQRFFFHAPDSKQQQRQQQEEEEDSSMSMVEKLQSFGLNEEGLPKTFGGTYQFKTAVQESASYIGNEDQR